MDRLDTQNREKQGGAMISGYEMCSLSQYLGIPYMDWFSDGTLAGNSQKRMRNVFDRSILELWIQTVTCGQYGMNWKDIVEKLTDKQLKNRIEYMWQ